MRYRTDPCRSVHQYQTSQKGKQMAQTAQIVGTVEYRGGDGPAVEIRKGSVNISLSATDATLSWIEEDVHGSAAMPVSDFQRYVKEGKIRLDGPVQAEPA